MARDPVCGMLVDADSAAGKSSYDGVTYFFCAPGCKRTFDGDPKKYQEPKEPRHKSAME